MSSERIKLIASIVTEKVRGLLCTSCNLSLGYARDDASLLRSLADYVELYSSS